MSEKKMKRVRFEQKVFEIKAFESWLKTEPPLWRLIKWHRWKRNRPAVDTVISDEAIR